MGYSNMGAALGLVLGRLSTIPVQQKVSFVGRGAMSNQRAWLGSVALEATGDDASVIASLGYITWRTFPHLAGYYLSGDDTCSATTNDYHMLARGRIIDKAHILAYTVFVQEVDANIPVNADGTIDAGYAKWLQQQIINVLGTSMVSQNNVVAADCFIDPTQNILATNQLNVVVKVRPTAYASEIDISLGFEA